MGSCGFGVGAWVVTGFGFGVGARVGAAVFPAGFVVARGVEAEPEDVDEEEPDEEVDGV